MPIKTLFVRFVVIFELSLMLFCINYVIADETKQSFICPSIGQISSPYGTRYGKFHSGVDIIDNRGRDIRSAESGKVVYSGIKGNYGFTIIIDHGQGIKTLYAHNAKNYVQKGEIVLQGQKIAQMGSSGRSTDIHLHFEVRVNGKTTDPIAFLRKHEGI